MLVTSTTDARFVMPIEKGLDLANVEEGPLEKALSPRTCHKVKP